ncbi:MAG: STAS domain-containing protein, partial [Proteobacteria bacterium]|nr:STAS domain-containing protein [Pseudomonadota bacterium]
AGVELCFAELKDPVKDKLKRFGLFSQLGEEHFFPTIDSAVASYRQIHAIAVQTGIPKLRVADP